MTDRDEAIRARCEAATPGEWKSDDYAPTILADNPYGHGSMCIADIRGWWHLTGQGACNMDYDQACAVQGANSDFIAHACTDIPDLIAEVMRLRAENAQLCETIVRERDANRGICEGIAAQNTRLRAELEAAERDFMDYMARNIKGTKGPYACDLCRHGNPDNPGTTCLKGCDGLNKWEWRGPCAENGGVE